MSKIFREHDELLKNALAVLLIGFIVVFLVITIREYLPFAIDWHLTYYPATHAFTKGETPYYEGSTLENPIWVCILLAPFAIFSEATGRALLLIASIIAYYAAFRNAGLSNKWIVLVFLSPQVLYGINMGTIDAFVLTAPLFHPIFGFMIAITKPQIGIGFIVFLVVEWIRQKKFKEMFIAFLLSGIGIGISIHLGMPFSGRLINVPWNTSLFPYSVLPGLVILALAILKRHKWGSVVASPMLAPYLTFHSWVTLFMINNTYYLSGIFIVSWVSYLIWHYTNL